MKHDWFLIGGVALLSGTLGFGIGQISVEKTLRKEYEESAASMRRAYQMAGELKADGPHKTEEDLVVVTGDIRTPEQELAADHVIFEPKTDLIQTGVQAHNQYHTAIAATETPIEMFIDGSINDYGISYIEDEEFLEADGRDKEHVELVLDEHDPKFFMDGEEVLDWDERLGDSIVVDFLRLVPAGIEQVLYVRNHKTETDYEVTREIP